MSASVADGLLIAAAAPLTTATVAVVVCLASSCLLWRRHSVGQRGAIRSGSSSPDGDVAQCAPRPSPGSADADERDDDESGSLASQLTVVISTSAAASNPSTLGIEAVVHSFGHFMPCLDPIRKVIVCDAPDLIEDARDDQTKSKKGKSDKPPPPVSFRSGRVGADEAGRYRAYVARLRALCRDTAGPWVGLRAECLVLERRHGFGLAVGAALELVTTPFVLVVQVESGRREPPLL